MIVLRRLVGTSKAVVAGEPLSRIDDRGTLKERIVRGRRKRPGKPQNNEDDAVR